MAVANGEPIRTLVISVVPVFRAVAVTVSSTVVESPVNIFASRMPAVPSMTIFVSIRTQVSNGIAAVEVATTVLPLTNWNWREVFSAKR